MSLYSEMMGSFIRTGNYPMEANYIFDSEAALKEFYSNPINATTLHKGLLKVVANEDSLSLYWVVQSNDTLEFVKLIEKIDIENITKLLEELLKDLSQIWGTDTPSDIPSDLDSILDLSKAVAELLKSVENYKADIKAIAGTDEEDIISYLKTLPYTSLTSLANALDKFLNSTDPESDKINTLPELQSFLKGYKDTLTLVDVLSTLKTDILGSPLPSKDFGTLRAIEDFVRILKSNLEGVDKNLQSELDTTQIGVGLSGDGSYNSDKETHYLKDATSVMNALKTLDTQIYEAMLDVTITTSNTDVVDLNIKKGTEGYEIGATLNLSNVIGNDLLKKEDGLYFNVKSTYSEGILSLYVNDKLVSLHILGFSSIVESAYYNSTDETIVIVFKLLSGEKQTVTIPVGTLIRELEVDNSLPDKVVELNRETIIDGADKLSADVRIYSDKHNILKKVGNALSVDGTSDSITCNDETLTSVIDSLKATDANLLELINNIPGSKDVSELAEKINNEITRATTKENELAEAIETKVSSVNISKNEETNIYTLYVNEVDSGDIDITPISISNEDIESLFNTDTTIE